MSKISTSNWHHIFSVVAADLLAAYEKVPVAMTWFYGC
jgi:hypothetical protein